MASGLGSEARPRNSCLWSAAILPGWPPIDVPTSKGGCRLPPMGQSGRARVRLGSRMSAIHHYCRVDRPTPPDHASPSKTDEDDGLRFFRGVLIGGLISIPLWACIFLLVRKLLATD